MGRKVLLFCKRLKINGLVHFLEEFKFIGLCWTVVDYPQLKWAIGDCQAKTREKLATAWTWPRSKRANCAWLRAVVSVQEQVVDNGKQVFGAGIDIAKQFTFLIAAVAQAIENETREPQNGIERGAQFVRGGGQELGLDVA